MNTSSWGMDSKEFSSSDERSSNPEVDVDDVRFASMKLVCSHSLSTMSDKQIRLWSNLCTNHNRQQFVWAQELKCIRVNQWMSSEWIDALDKYQLNYCKAILVKQVTSFNKFAQKCMKSNREHLFNKPSSMSSFHWVSASDVEWISSGWLVLGQETITFPSASGDLRSWTWRDLISCSSLWFLSISAKSAISCSFLSAWIFQI